MSNYITIGMDLGNEKHAVCALDQAGKVLWRRDVANTPEALRPFFKENAGATVAMETGLCCRWISALAKSCGCEVLVGNARRLAAIWQNKQKNDENDALMLARLARADRELFHPVELRDDERHEMVQIIELFHKVAKDAIPADRAWKFKPMIRHLKEIAATVRRYDAMLEKYAQSHFGDEVELVRTMPGVGPVTSCAFVAVVGNAGRFGRARDVGPYVGLTPAQDQSGDRDAPMHVTKSGNALLRRLLVTSANYVMRKSSPDTALKRHGTRISARGGKIAKRKAKVAVARKIAVVLLAMLKSGRPYDDTAAGEASGASGAAV